MGRFLLLSTGLFLISGCLLLLLIKLATLLGQSDCTFQRDHLEASFWRSNTKTVDIPDNLVEDVYLTSCYREQVAKDTLAGKSNVDDLYRAQRAYWATYDRVSKYLPYSGRTYTNREDIAQWLVLAQSKNEDPLTKVVQWKTVGNRLQRRVFDHTGLLITRWETVGF